MPGKDIKGCRYQSSQRNGFADNIRQMTKGGSLSATGKAETLKR
jgi:hypothetical protein